MPDVKTMRRLKMELAAGLGFLNGTLMWYMGYGILTWQYWTGLGCIIAMVQLID